jgi:glycosyltransferase involved in cell wall biosynthesis
VNETRKKNRQVAILQHRLLHYRTDFFDKLRDKCVANDIELRLVHGQPSAADKLRKDEGHLSWSTRTKNHFFRIGGVDLIWQERPDNLHNMDLVVVIQENRILSSYPVLMKGKYTKTKIAFWGHGANFQSKSPKGLREKWKKFWINGVDWWFSYTDVTTDLLLRGGFPKERITTLNNAVDTQAFSAQVSSFSEAELMQLCSQYNLNTDDKIAVFCGSLYPDKKIGLMLESCDFIKQQVPNFQLLVVGDGPSAVEVREAAKTRPWIHFLGVKKNRDKAACFRLSHVMLNPGTLGLHILDAFAIGMPLVSTVNALHSPEIAYLENGKNGVLVEGDDPKEYANAVVRLLNDPDYYHLLAQQAKEDGAKYTLDKMVDNFHQGIIACLAS